MKILIEQSEWLFALAKGATLVLGWVALSWYAKNNLQFVRKASLWGSVAYLVVWCSWFFGAMITGGPATKEAVPEAPVESSGTIYTQLSSNESDAVRL